MRINCENCPMHFWCERPDKDYTCAELMELYQQSIARVRKAANFRHKVRFEDLYIINADWGADTKLNIKLGRGLNESFLVMEVRKAVLNYGSWIVEGYRGDDVILYKGD